MAVVTRPELLDPLLPTCIHKANTVEIDCCNFIGNFIDNFIGHNLICRFHRYVLEAGGQ